MQKYKYSKNEKLSPLLTWNLRKIFGKIKAPPQKNRPIQQLSPLRLKTRFLASIGHRGCLSKSQIGRCRRLQSMPDPPHPFYRPRHQIIKSEKCARSPHHIIGDCHSSWLWIWWVQKKLRGVIRKPFLSRAWWGSPLCQCITRAPSKAPLVSFTTYSFSHSTCKGAANKVKLQEWNSEWDMILKPACIQLWNTSLSTILMFLFPKKTFGQ